MEGNVEDRDAKPLGAGRGRMMAESKGTSHIYGARKSATRARFRTGASRSSTTAPAIHPLSHIYLLGIYVQ